MLPTLTSFKRLWKYDCYLRLISLLHQYFVVILYHLAWSMLWALLSLALASLYNFLSSPLSSNSRYKRSKVVLCCCHCTHSLLLCHLIPFPIRLHFLLVLTFHLLHICNLLCCFVSLNDIDEEFELE